MSSNKLQLVLQIWNNMEDSKNYTEKNLGGQNLSQ